MLHVVFTQVRSIELCARRRVRMQTRRCLRQATKRKSKLGKSVSLIHFASQVFQPHSSPVMQPTCFWRFAPLLVEVSNLVVAVFRRPCADSIGVLPVTLLPFVRDPSCRCGVAWTMLRHGVAMEMGTNTDSVKLHVFDKFGVG